MPSNKFIEKAKEISKRDKEVFDTLMDFEKTKEIRSKTRMNFTVDKVIARNFKKFCREKGYNMSNKIEQAMEKIMKE